MCGVVSNKHLTGKGKERLEEQEMDNNVRFGNCLSSRTPGILLSSFSKRSVRLSSVLFTVNLDVH